MEISKPVYKDLPDQPSLMRFELFLKNHRVVSTPTVAVPGLSPHGQLRALYFQIKQRDKIIAGTHTEIIKDVGTGKVVGIGQSLADYRSSYELPRRVEY